MSLTSVMALRMFYCAPHFQSEKPALCWTLGIQILRGQTDPVPALLDVSIFIFLKVLFHLLSPEHSSSVLSLRCGGLAKALPYIRHPQMHMARPTRGLRVWLFILSIRRYAFKGFTVSHKYSTTSTRSLSAQRAVSSFLPNSLGSDDSSAIILLTTQPSDHF